MVPRGSKIFIDTVAIAGAHETSCWRAILHGYKFVSSDYCIGEVTRPNRDGKKLVYTDPQDLAKELTVLPVTQSAVEKLDLVIEGVADVDHGEKTLLVLALEEKQPIWWLCGPDKGTLRALNYIHMRHGLACSMDRMCALESLAKGVGVNKSFDGKSTFKFSEKWLQQSRMKILTG